MRARARARSACAGSLTLSLAFPRSRPGKFDGTTQKNGVRPTHWTTAADERQWKRRVGVENHFHAPGDDARRRQEEELAASAFAGFDEHMSVALRPGRMNQAGRASHGLLVESPAVGVLQIELPK